MSLIDKQFLKTPWYGSRQIARHLQRQDHKVGRHRIRRLMRLMRLVLIYREPDTSKKHPGHKIYPYLLKGMKIDHPNLVWCSDITYIPMQRGFLYLVVIMDWYSRKVLSWRLSNTMEADFCVEALKEALATHGKPQIFNTDPTLAVCKQTAAVQRGSQFTSSDWIEVLKEAEIQISMDGRGRWIDNRMVERLWRSLKYECVYIPTFETGSQTKAGIREWIDYYNTERPHSSHGILTPNEAHANQNQPIMRVAA